MAVGLNTDSNDAGGNLQLVQTQGALHVQMLRVGQS